MMPALIKEVFFAFYLIIDVVSSVGGRVYMLFDMISRDLRM